MAVIIKDGEFDPSLRSRIAAFIDAFFEGPDHDEEAPASARAVIRMEGHRPSASPSSRRDGLTGTFGRAFGSLGALRDKKAFAPSDEEAARSAASLDVDRKTIAPCEDAGVDFANESFGDSRRAAATACEEASTLKSWLDQVDESFSTTLFALIDLRGLDDVEVYKRAHMSRQLFSRIRSDASYRPAKKTVLALAIAMRLSLDEMGDLLERAGFALSRSSKRDLIVEYFVSNGIYDLFTINEALYEFDQPLI